MKKHIIFIINPISGKGKGRFIESDIVDFFKDKPYRIEIIFAEYAGHAKEIVQDKINESPDIIVACGGDGTINEIAQGLIGSHVKLGIVPIGSGNGLASNLNIPKAIDLALENIKSDKLTTIDVGKVNDKYFFSNIGLGIDAFVIERYTNKKQRNFIGYLKATVWSFFNFIPVSLKVCFDQNDFQEKEYFFVLCSNSDEAGYNISFTPDAKLNDGLLDVLCVEKLNLFELIYFFYAVLFNRLHLMKKAYIKQVKTISFESLSKNVKAQIDGESVMLNTSKVEISVLPKALQIIGGK